MTSLLSSTPILLLPQFDCTMIGTFCGVFRFTCWGFVAQTWVRLLIRSLTRNPLNASTLVLCVCIQTSHCSLKSAGSALLSSVAREAGFGILPIDAGKKAPRSFAHVLRSARRSHSAVPAQCVPESCRWLDASLHQRGPWALHFVRGGPRGLTGLKEPAASRVLADNKIFDHVAALL